MTKYLSKRIYHSVGKAIDDWGMIADGNKVLLGVSGGQDSQALLKILFDLKARAPIHFDVLPVYIDAGFEGSFAKDLQLFIARHFGPSRVEYTDHGVLAHSEINRKNPCFLCSRLRRKRLFEIAKEEGCDKVALAHNKDDIIETFFINIFYSGKIGTMKPFQTFFNGEIKVIRPLAYVEKKDIITFCDRFRLPEFKNTCPSAGRTKRSSVRKMLETLYEENEHIKGNIFRAMANVASDYLLMR